jgi:arylsulfatase A-like enzyme/Flp pilus assembly protein TadD
LRYGGLAAIVVVVAAALVFKRSASLDWRPAGPIDVVLITVDTLRADRLGSYGGRAAATPVLDKLAAEGTRFDQAIAPVPLTLPSHASLLTGRTPLGHGVHDNVGFSLAPSIPTLAEQLRAAGYTTAAFVSAVPLQRRFGLARGFEQYDDQLTRGTDPARPLPVERRADETVAAVQRWLPGIAAPSPLFLWVHLFDPHTPYDPPEPFKTRFSVRPYDGEVAYVDSQVGVLLAQLNHMRGHRPRLVVVTADHGEGLGDHGEPTHGLFVYDSTIRVPLILNGPDVPAGSVVQRVARIIDVAPTVLDLAGVAPLSDIEGTSLRAAPTRDEAAPDRPAYVEALFGALCCGWAPLRGWRDGSLMLIDAPRVELYDIGADPGQTRNLAQDRPADVTRLQGVLSQALSRASTSSFAATANDARSQLRSLGYVSGGSTAKPSLRDPKDAVALSVRIARALEVEETDPAAAVRELEAVLAEDPGNPLARRHLGMALARLGRFDAAVGRLRALVSDGDSSAETLGALGNALAAAGKGEDARAVLEKLLSISPDDRDASRMLADLALERRDFIGARRHLERLSAHDPDDTDAAFKLGVIAIRLGDMERAISAFQAVAAREPRNVDALIDLAGALLKAGRPGDAVTRFEQAIASGAGSLGWNGLAAAKLQLSDKAGAADALRQSLRVSPDQPDVRTKLRELSAAPP